MTIIDPERPRDMRAAFIRETGGIDRIEVEVLPVPQCGPTDVLVRLTASAVNHVDLFVRSGAYRTHTPFPFVIGRDLVGTVVACGSGVDRFDPGDVVWCNSLGHGGRQGAWAEYAAVAADRLYMLPAGVDPVLAAAVLHTAATACLGLARVGRLLAGQTVLVEGAGGGVGSAVVQLARFMGARVVATASSADAAWCRSCGADRVFDYHREDLYEAVREAEPEGVDLWWDASGHNHFEAGLALLNRGAHVVVMAGLRGGSPVLPVGALYTRDITLHGFVISNATTGELAEAARVVNHLLADGRLQARIGATFHLDQAAQAQQAMADGHAGGRIIMLP